jgi:hypothetical protein
MRFLKQILFLLVLCPLPTKASHPESYLIFANGMRNTLQEAELSLQLLRQSVIDDLKYQSEQRHQSLRTGWSSDRVALAYNFKDELLDEFREVFRQKKTERAISFWKWYHESVEASQILKEIIHEEMMMCENESRLSETLYEQMQLYDDLYRKGFRAVVVAHSQGNLFSNMIFEALEEKRGKGRSGLAVVAVATPASYVAGSGRHFTLTSDGVINRILPTFTDNPNYLKPLRPNVSNTTPKPGNFDHEFIEFYLGGDIAGPRIKNQIYDLFLQPKWN